MMKRFQIFFLLCALLTPSLAHAACELAISTPFQVLSLISDPLLNDLTQGKAGQEVINIYDAPDGIIIGKMTVMYQPNGDDNIYANISAQGKTVKFKPKMYDDDWGYGVMFHFTVLNEKDNWHELALPIVTSGWVQRDEESSDARDDVHVLSTGGPKNFIALEKKKNSTVVRDEQPADMWCDAGNPPPLKRFKKREMGYKSFYDNDCQLTIVPAYPRGC